MRYEYGGRFAEIQALGGEARRGFYVFGVETDEVGPEGEPLVGIEDMVKHAVPLASLRARAEANGTTVQVEAQAVRDAAVEAAKVAFQDAVDGEALSG